ncbi:HAD family hydrolase [Brevibacterium litoralis]|uniref:HAD family hydrolase n=1 Tax=Brevibacterium litoralis TaxID=3138935 RepID=UPI0032EE09BE
MSDRHLVALDVDGTIVDYDDRMSERVRETVRAVEAAGHHVVVSTGRSIRGALEVANRLGLETGYVVASNGAVIARLDPSAETGWEVVHTETFDPRPALERMHAAMPTGILLVEDENLVRHSTAEFPDGDLNGDAPLTIVPFADLLDLRAIRIVLRELSATSEEFAAAVEDSGLHGVTYSVGWSNWLDISPEGVSKASALRIVAENLRVAPEHTVAAGDGTNDHEMLDWAHHAIVMGQAKDETKAFATLVTAPVHEDGLALALEDHFGVRPLA